MLADEQVNNANNDLVNLDLYIKKSKCGLDSLENSFFVKCVHNKFSIKID